MFFPVYEMLSYFSRHMRMVPGDILATGTPPGVGTGKNRFMAVGDILECGITNLDAQRHEIVAGEGLRKSRVTARAPCSSPTETSRRGIGDVALFQKRMGGIYEVQIQAT
jgi:hypothetical protein